MIVAIPPEPLPELLAAADAVVVAEVTELLGLGKKPPPPPGAAKLRPGATDVGYKEATQKLRLKIVRVLHGKVSGDSIVVDKPEAPYALRPGDKGPFFLKDGAIIGRYGPDTHSLKRIEAALAKN